MIGAEQERMQVESLEIEGVRRPCAVKASHVSEDCLVESFEPIGDGT